MTELLALHIPDGFLSNGVAALCWIPTVIAVAIGLRKASTDLSEARVPLLGVTAAFVFAAQMLNFPIAGGTSGHFLGAALAAILLGPWVACVAMAVVITMQAFVFADGGITALGANILNMGVIGALLVGYLMLGTRDVLPKSRGVFLGITAAGAWLAVMVGATATAIELSLSGTVPFATVLLGDARRSRTDRARRGGDHRRCGRCRACPASRPDRGERPDPRRARARARARDS